MNARVIVTRPAQDAPAWVGPLRHAGFDAEAIPLIDIGAPRSPGSAESLEAARQSLNQYAAVFFVSGNAVAHFFETNQPHALGLTAWNATEIIANSAVRFLAPGPGTARALRAAGVPASRIDTPPLDAGQFDSQTLWQQLPPHDWHGKRVLIVRGDSAPGSSGSTVAADNAHDSSAPGRDWIARQWMQAGAAVDFLVVYERRPPSLSAAQIARIYAASADGTVWLFSSSEAVDNLLALPALAGMSWQHARAVATHPRIASRVHAAHWGVVAQSRPTLADIARSIESMSHE